jgi:hypothetical protein
MTSRRRACSSSTPSRSRQVLDGVGAHAGREVLAEAVAQLAVVLVVGQQLLGGHVLEHVQDPLEQLDPGRGLLAHVLERPLGLVPGLAALVGLGPLGLQLGQVGLQLGLDLLLALLLVDLDLLALVRQLGLDPRQVVVTAVVVDPGHHVGREVDDLLEVLGGHVEQVAEPARHALDVPDVGDGRGQLDVAHALAAHLGPGDLDAAALTDDALEADALVLAAVALPVPRRPEDLLAEQAVLLGLEGAVVDRLRLADLAV